MYASSTSLITAIRASFAARCAATSGACGIYARAAERIVFSRFLKLGLPISLAQLLAAAYIAAIGCTGWGRGIGERRDPRFRPPSCVWRSNA
jgi:hypothetical protein